MMLFHPYHHLTFKIAFILSLRFFLIWGGVMGLYHGFYFVINLSERLPVTVERLFPYGYIVLACLGLFIHIKNIYGIFKNFSHFLEEHFELDFQWFNTLDQYRNPSSVPSDLVTKVFHKVNWSIIWERLTSKQILILTGIGGWLLYPLLFISLPSYHSRFFDNFWTLWNYQEPYLDMQYPDFVLQNESYQLTFRGDYRKAIFKYSGQEWILEPEESLIITNVLNSFNLNYRLEKGRILKMGRIPVKVIYPPKITAQVFTIKQPYERNSYTLEGIYNLIASSQSEVSLFVSYQEDQSIVDYEVIPITQNGEPSSVSPEVISHRAHQLTINLTLSQDVSLNIRVKNNYGQWSKKDTFTLNIRKNQPPSVIISEPEAIARLDHPRPVRVGFVAKDDVSLKDITLQYQIINKQNWIKDVLKNLPSSPSTTLWVSNFYLPLNSLNALPGSHLRYYLQARDLEGGIGYSSTNEVRINTIAETYSQSLKGGEHLHKGLNDRQEDFNNLERDYEKLKILSETKKINNQDIKNFQENINEFSKKMQEDISNIEELEKDNYKNKQIISKNFRDKLLELKKSLENLDKDYLQKMNQKFQNILNNIDEGIKPDEVIQFMQTLDLKDMESRVEQTLIYLEQLKQMQKIDSLEQLSQNLYLRYKDLETYIIANLVTPQQIEQEAKSIKKGIEFIKSEFAEIAPKLPDDHRVQLLKKNIKAELTDEKLNHFDQLVQRSQDDDSLKKLSNNLDQLRRNLARLNSLNQNFSQEKLLKSINFQILSLNRKINWIENIEDGKEYDVTTIEEKKQLELITQFLSKHKTLLYNFREQAFILSSTATLEIDFMQHYDKAIEKLEEIQRKTSPDQQQPHNKKKLNLEQNLLTVKHTTSILSRELILLKNILNKIQDTQQQNMTLNRTMEMQRNLNHRIQKMLQQNNLSEREKEYLKNMALEQNLLRSLMEEADRQQSGQRGQQGQGGGHSQEEGRGQGNNGKSSGDNQTGKGKYQNEENGSDKNNPVEGGNGENQEDNLNSQSQDGEGGEGQNNKKRQQVIDKMRLLERELLKDNPDLAIIRELQQIIEDNLFKETQGLQSKDGQDSEERLAEKENLDYKNNLSETAHYRENEIKKRDRISLEKLKSNQLNIPPEFQGRVRRFLELNSVP